MENILDFEQAKLRHEFVNELENATYEELNDTSDGDISVNEFLYEMNILKQKYKSLSKRKNKH